VRVARSNPETTGACVPVPGGAQHVRVAPREDHQVPGRERFDAAVGERELGVAAGDDVHAAEPGGVEPDPERGAELEPPVGGALEAQLPQHQAQDVHAGEPSGRAHRKTNGVVSQTITHGLSQRRDLPSRRYEPER
jgi:hypothetical protein